MVCCMAHIIICAHLHDQNNIPRSGMIADMARMVAYFIVWARSGFVNVKVPLQSILNNPTCEFSASRASPLSWNSWTPP